MAIKVGNLSPVRDFSDVRDVTRAFAAVMEKGESGEVYNVGSGSGTRISDLLEMVTSASETEVEVTVDPARLRPVDEPIMVGDITKLSTATGWRPTILLSQTVADVLHTWRALVRGGAV